MVDVGVLIEPADGYNYGTIERNALECERLGFESVWISDHLASLKNHARPDPVLECWTVLTALAVRTSRIRLGPMVLCNSYRYPAVLAKMAATLDVVSNGRLNFGIGSGWYEKEYNALGVRFDDNSTRLRQLREAVSLIKRLWTDERVDFTGEYYTVKEAVQYPKPIQKPHPPVWIGGNSAAVLRTAVDIGDACNLARFLTPKQFGKKMSFLQGYCSKIGRDYERVVRSHLLWVMIGQDRTEAEAECRRVIEEFRPLPIEKLLEGTATGTPDECTEKLNNYVNAGATHLIAYFPRLIDLKPLHLFADQVLPRLKHVR